MTNVSLNGGGTRMGTTLLQIAVVYLVVGALLGAFMGATQQFALAPVYAHALLLGWASLALAGVVYHLYPAASATRLARIHFRLHNVGLPIFMIALAALVTGHQSATLFIAISSNILIAGLAIFAINVLKNVKAPVEKPKSAEAAN